jgi:two-component system sensor histidine kinase VicK
MLVFIAMIIAGVFIINSYTNYYEEDVENRIDDINAVINQNLEKIEDLEGESDKVYEILSSFQSSGFSQEIFVLSMNNYMIASTLGDLTIDPLSMLDFNLLITGMEKNIDEMKAINTESFTFDKIYPIVKSDEKIGNVYIRYDMTDIYRALDENRFIIVQATALASIITIILGFFVARSITEPINDVTYKAAKMASGDFNQYVEVKSKDEIGKLAEMFNTLTNRLRESISEIYQEKSKMEAIVNQMADGLIAIDLDGNVVHINQRALQILKMREKDAFQLKYEYLIERYNLNLSLETIKESGRWVGTETVYAKESIYKLKYAPFEDDNSNKIGIVIIIQDITEEERLEKMRREFVANVSHELKTPLTSIKSYIETILDGVVDDEEEVKGFLSVVNNEADRMTRLVRDLLQLGNFDSKKIKFDFEYHDYIGLIFKTTDKIRVMAEKKQQTINIDCDCSEIVGYFDYDRIEQVIINILSNAVKYTKDHGIILIECKNTLDEIEIKISDNGLGIPEDDLKRIFERFYRVDKARSRELGGTGLGLSIAKEIVEVHDGKVKIDSKVGEGTSVTITIPLKLIEI